METSDVDIKDEPLTYLQHQDQAHEMSSETKDIEGNIGETFVPSYSECSTVKLQPKEELSGSDVEMIGEEILSIDCIHCPRTFSSEITLNEHYKTHHFCKLCKESFTDDRYFYTHILDHHINYNTIPVSCQFCTHEIIDNDILKHMKEHAFTKDKEVNKASKKRNRKVIKTIIGIVPQVVGPKKSINSEQSNHTAVKQYSYTEFQDVPYKRQNKNKIKINVPEGANTGNKYKTKKPELQENNVCEKCLSILEPKGKHVCSEICYQCNARFPNKDRLSEHVQDEHFKRDICEICKLDTMEIPDIVEHVKTCVIKVTSSGYKKYICKVCDSKVKSKIDLENHTKVNHFINEKCEICDMTLIEITQCVEHLNGCLLVKDKYPDIQKQKYCCFYCHVYFNSKILLKKHITAIHVMYKKCGVCRIDIEKIPDNTEHFKLCAILHEDIKHKDLPFAEDQSYVTESSNTICRTCSNDYARSTELKKHYIKYPYGKCRINRINHSQKISRPTKSKSSSKNFKCIHCNKKYFTDLELSIHVSSNHECDHCDITFKNRYNLINHLIFSYNRGESMVCKFCNVFIQPSIVEHLKSHILKEYKTCEKCRTVYLQSSNHFSNSKCFPQSKLVVFNSNDADAGKT